MQISNTNLCEKQKQILMLLYFYKGMSAINLTVFVTRSIRFTLSEEKSTYKMLTVLKNEGLVYRHQCEQGISKDTMYCLTKNGLEITKNVLNNEFDKNGIDWLPY